MLAPGDLLAGKYRVERVLGQGGMGCVVAAVHVQLGQRVAIKFLFPETRHRPEVVERFVREARAAARLRSQHVGRVLDVGRFEDGTPYMVMEYLDGHDLGQLLARHGPLPVIEAVDLVLQACEAVAEAHALDIVHRDLKPANLFVTQGADGAPLLKVLDFGIAKSGGPEPSNLTVTGTAMGTPTYMPPEQLRSARECDARADIWALGVVLFQLTSGRLPFPGDAISEITLKIAMDPTPPLAVVDAPPGFEDVVQRCLRKAPAERFPDIAELVAALAPFGSRSRRGRGAVADLPTTLGSATGAASSPAPRRGRALTAATVLVTAALVALAGVLIVSGGAGGVARSSGPITPAAETTPAAPPPPPPPPPPAPVAVSAPPPTPAARADTDEAGVRRRWKAVAPRRSPPRRAVPGSPPAAQPTAEPDITETRF